MLKSKYGIALESDDKPFYFAWDSSREHVLLIDSGVQVQVFQDGKWIDAEPRVLRPIEWHDITKKEFLAATGGVLPDVDPADLMQL